MSVGTMSIDGVQVAEIESFSFEPTVEAPIGTVTGPMLSPGMYHSITLPVSIRNEAMSRPLRLCPKGRWVHWAEGRMYLVRGRAAGYVSDSYAVCWTVDGSAVHNKRNRRRCESKRWVERTHAEAWYREEMHRRWVFAMGFRVEGEANR